MWGYFCGKTKLVCDVSPTVRRMYKSTRSWSLTTAWATTTTKTGALPNHYGFLYQGGHRSQTASTAAKRGVPHNYYSQ